jgi:ribulose-5-phosphate 4-epimerase/fuculose-1-phosphate aldolase
MGEPREDVAAVARMLARAGLVDAFGHVSVREGSSVWISSTRPLLGLGPEDVVELDPDGQVVSGPDDDLPIEAPLHRAIYAARADIGAIARGHPPNAVAWGTGTQGLPLLHGLGALAGLRVPNHPDVDLIADDASAKAAAATLDGCVAMLLRANGALAVGATAVEAATRLFYLEDRARVALRSTDVAAVGEDEWRGRERHVDAELARAVRWFARRFGGDGGAVSDNGSPDPGGTGGRSSA